MQVANRVGGTPTSALVPSRTPAALLSVIYGIAGFKIVRTTPSQETEESAV